MARIYKIWVSAVTSLNVDKFDDGTNDLTTLQLVAANSSFEEIETNNHETDRDTRYSMKERIEIIA